MCAVVNLYICATEVLDMNQGMKNEKKLSFYYRNESRNEKEDNKIFFVH